MKKLITMFAVVAFAFAVQAANCSSPAGKEKKDRTEGKCAPGKTDGKCAPGKEKKDAA